MHPKLCRVSAREVAWQNILAQAEHVNCPGLVAKGEDLTQSQLFRATAPIRKNPKL